MIFQMSINGSDIVAAGLNQVNKMLASYDKMNIHMVRIVTRIINEYNT